MRKKETRTRRGKVERQPVNEGPKEKLQSVPSSDAVVLPPVVSRIPFEILSRIFLMYKDMFNSAISPSEEEFRYDINVKPKDIKPGSYSVYVEGQGVLLHPQFLFTQVCRNWRNAALGTAGLWDSVSWNPKWENVMTDYWFLKEIVEHGKGLGPIDIDIFPDGIERLCLETENMITGGRALLEMISQFCDRWRKLRAQFPMSTIDWVVRKGVRVGEQRIPSPSLPMLESLHLHLIGSLGIQEPILMFENAPLLKEVCISARFCTYVRPYNTPFESYSLLRLPWAQLTRLELLDVLAEDAEALQKVFTACQKLELAVLCVPDLDVEELDRLAVDESAVVAMANLKSLQLRFRNPNAVPFIVDSVKFPTVERLELFQSKDSDICDPSWAGEALFELINRDLPPLKILKMANLDAIYDGAMSHVLCGLDELEELYIDDMFDRTFSHEDLFQQLMYAEKGNHNVLPELKSLTIHMSFCYDSDSEAEELLKVVISRWKPQGRTNTQLQCMYMNVMEEYCEPEVLSVWCSLEKADLVVNGGAVSQRTVDRLRQCEKEGLMLKLRYRKD